MMMEDIGGGGGDGVALLEGEEVGIIMKGGIENGVVLGGVYFSFAAIFNHLF